MNRSKVKVPARQEPSSEELRASELLARAEERIKEELSSASAGALTSKNELPIQVTEVSMRLVDQFRHQEPRSSEDLEKAIVCCAKQIVERRRMQVPSSEDFDFNGVKVGPVECEMLKHWFWRVRKNTYMFLLHEAVASRAVALAKQEKLELTDEERNDFGRDAANMMLSAVISNSLHIAAYHSYLGRIVQTFRRRNLSRSHFVDVSLDSVEAAYCPPLDPEELQESQRAVEQQLASAFERANLSIRDREIVETLAPLSREQRNESGLTKELAESHNMTPSGVRGALRRALKKLRRNPE